jgi:hypothetical protein
VELRKGIVMGDLRMKLRDALQSSGVYQIVSPLISPKRRVMLDQRILATGRSDGFSAEPREER